MEKEDFKVAILYNETPGNKYKEIQERLQNTEIDRQRQRQRDKRQRVRERKRDREERQMLGQ